MFENELWKKVKSNVIFKVFVMFLVILIFVIIIDQILMPLYVRLGDEIELPDVVEMNINEAQKKLIKDGFSVTLADSVYDANYEEGTVVEQMPPPFSVVKEGRRVYLTLSIGEKPIIMPNLFYKSPRDAELILESYGLDLDSKFYEYNDISLEGVVIAQSYPQGQVIKKGTKIAITISLGPFPTQKTVPGLTGKSLDAAQKQLELLGISNIDIVYEERENILPETILGQSLKAGTPIEEDMRIELTVSKILLSEGE